MDKFSVSEVFGEEIRNIFYNRRYRDFSGTDRGFISINNIPTDSILFLGINPSYTDNSFSDAVTFYDLQQRGNAYKQYFGKFENISEATGIIWGHMDLLYFRETQQNIIDEIMKEQDGVSFIWEQLQVSKKILEKVKPKILIVSNTKARQFLGKDKFKDENVWLDYDFSFDLKIGTHRVTNENSTLRNIPVFFTSMLTGQRALDNGSYERLVWHIKFALNEELNDES